MRNRKPPETDFFWELAQRLLEDERVSEGTLMGFPCLRANGEFFGACDHRTGDLIAKLSAPRVTELIESGEGEPFAPSGRVFQEWVLVVKRDAERWLALLAEARTRVINR